MTAHSMTYRLLISTVALWRIANTMASISSKRVMIGEDHTTSGATSWTPAFEDLRWVDLTVFQLLLGGAVAMIWLRRSVHKSAPIHDHHPNTSRRAIITAICGHVVGNLATNAAYAAISSSTAQVIKASEPIFTFVLLKCLYHENSESANYLIPISILTMSLGASMFVSGDASFNIWGMSAAIASNIAFAVRNLSLKVTCKCLDSPLQKYAILSTYDGILVLPLLVARLLVTREWLGSWFRAEDTVVSSSFHFLYNIASISVLQNVSPLSHAILNLSKTMFVILANIAYFAMPLSWKMYLGLLVFAAGLTLYHLKPSCSWRIRLPPLKLALLSISLPFLFAVCITVRVHSTNTIILRHPVNSIPATCEESITTAWVFAEAMPEESVANIEAMQAHNPEKSVVVHCGTSQCMRIIQDMKNPKITSQFLIISNAVKDTPLEVWFNRHPFNKILAGAEFENHLHDAVHLAMQWQNGGLYFNPSVRVSNVDFPPCQQPWISARHTVPAKRSVDIPSHKVLELSNFPSHHPFVWQLAEAYVRQYPKKGGTDNMTWPIAFNFQKVVWDTYRNSYASNNMSCPTLVALQVAELNNSKGSRVGHHFGTLAYDKRVHTTKVANLGDEIQGFPGLHFIPFLDTFLDREALDESKGSEKITAFFDAWWGDAQTSWPPPDNIDPILLSIHIAPLIKATMATNKSTDYFQSKAPIGCREFAEKYNGRVWGANGPGLITRVWKEWTSGLASNNNDSSTLHVLSHSAFYVFPWNKVEIQCFHETSGRLFESNMKLVKEKAYAVHLNSKVTGMEGTQDKLRKGTICKYLLNQCCVLCNRLH